MINLLQKSDLNKNLLEKADLNLKNIKTDKNGYKNG